MLQLRNREPKGQVIVLLNENMPILEMGWQTQPDATL